MVVTFAGQKEMTDIRGHLWTMWLLPFTAAATVAG